MSETIGVVKKFPDYVEVQEDENGKRTLIWVCQRATSRSLIPELRGLLEVLQDPQTEHKVVVRTAIQDLTLEQFAKFGTFGLSTKVYAQSTFYGKQAEIRRIEKMMSNLPSDNPAREELVLRVRKLQTEIGMNETTIDEVKKSDDAFNAMIPNVLAAMTDASLAAMTIDDLEKFKIPKNTPTWSALLDRRALAQKEIQAHAQQSAATNPDNADLTAREESGTSSAPKTPNEG